MNINGLNFTSLPESLRSVLESQDQAQTENLQIGSTSGNGEKGLGYDKDFAFICKNFNENEVIVPPSTSPPSRNTNTNNVYVVWEDNTPGNYDIFFSASNDNGQTFSDPINIRNNDEFSSDPQLAIEGNNVYVVWQEFSIGNSEILFAASNDNGLTFSLPDNLSKNDRLSQAPQISSEGNNVYVVWQDGTNTFGEDEILFAASNDNGETFSMPDNLSNIPDSSSIHPQFSRERNNVYVVWREFDTTNTPENYEIFFKSSDNNGENFKPAYNISKNTGDSGDQQISSNIS